LPAVPGAKVLGADVAAAAGTTVVAINAGGGATGTVAADADFGSGTWTYNSTAAIDTSGVTGAAPQAAYQDEREGSTLAYTIPGSTRFQHRHQQWT
jgi:hypothetical protein